VTRSIDRLRLRAPWHARASPLLIAVDRLPSFSLSQVRKALMTLIQHDIVRAIPEHIKAVRVLPALATWACLWRARRALFVRGPIVLASLWSTVACSIGCPCRELAHCHALDLNFSGLVLPPPQPLSLALAQKSGKAPKVRTSPPHAHSSD